MLSPSCSIYSRDLDYYFSDGNAVLLVEDTLFKVHRSILSKDGSTFANLFVLPTQLGSSEEGNDDRNPICLQGDTAEQFRALLWALYALPAEIIQFTMFAGDHRFYHIARLANKYHFATTETWALEAIPGYFNRIDTQLVVADLIPATEVAFLCEHDELKKLTVSRWKHYLGEPTDIVAAINISEKLNIPDLLGEAYHRMMLLGREVWDSSLTASQRIRLLSGFYNIYKICESLGSNEPKYVHANSCPNHFQCYNDWTEIWNIIHKSDGGIIEQLMSIQKFDLLGKLMLTESIMKNMIDDDPSMRRLAASIAKPCLIRAYEATQCKLAETRSNLANYFANVE
ncbi:hypothetical protein BDQ12DRAFT_691724 [Crucibulum laeve]|uniref:BTB domain-containing protein n=1 Tax=Crucibulum laeve TaxID=68775 RepID=A0A5C3LKF1_9AGAR|nr:hypothetical protein BDQ12DRAFT_691724 [Crucibulum laeve]